MSKNTVIALVLSFVVLIMYQLFMKKEQKIAPKNVKLIHFQGIKNVDADYQNGYIKLSWNSAKDPSNISYGIFFKEGSKILDFNNPVYFTKDKSFIISDIDMTKNYYFAVRAFDPYNNSDKNEKQVYFKSEFKDKGLKEKVIKFENENAIYHFSTLGGRLKNIILKKYKTMDKKDQVNLVYYSKKAHSYYYPLDLKIFNSKDNYDSLKFNDLTSYSSQLKGNSIIFTAVVDKNIKVIKEYKVNNNYVLKVNVRLEKTSSSKVNYNRIALKWQPVIGPINTLDKYDMILNSYYVNENIKKIKFKKKNYNTVIVKKAMDIKWIAMHNRYFAAAIIPDETYNVKEAIFHSDGKRELSGIVSSIDMDKLNSRGVEYNYTVYAGPKLRGIFKSTKALNTLKKTISNRKFILGIGKFITKLGYIFLDIMLFIYGIFKSYGLAIIIFTILIKLCLYPVTHKQFESMVKMQKIQPVITQVKEQYKNDSQRMNKELMLVYKKYKVNPFGGCLPIVLQIPIFFAIWDMLQYSLELRTASFLWIKSLALPDTVGFIGSIPINILPIIMGVTMLLQQKQTSTDAKQKTMMYFLPLIFLIFFWKMPSGLVLYWTVQNILSIGQQSLIKKYQNKPIEAEGEKK